jgi:hypothetical protein
VNAPATARSLRTCTFTLRRNTKRCSCDAIASASPSASTSITWSSASRSSWNTARVRPLALSQALHCQCSRGRAVTSLLNWAWAKSRIRALQAQQLVAGQARISDESRGQVVRHVNEV